MKPDRGLIPAAGPAGRPGVSVRTICRDVESLSGVGRPGVRGARTARRIALLPGFRTDVTGPTGDGSRALFVLAAQGARTALGRDGALGPALREVMAALPEAGLTELWGAILADHDGSPALHRVDRVRAATSADEPVRRRPGVELAGAREVLRRRAPARRQSSQWRLPRPTRRS